MPAPTNFILCGYNTADASANGTPRAVSQISGGEATNLVDYGRPYQPWVTASAGPHATELFMEYVAAFRTRAFHLGGGLMPVHGSRLRVVRGSHLTPTLVHYDAITANTNATGSIDRSVDPRAGASATFVGPASAGSDWSATFSLAEAEFGWSDDANQKLVVLLYAVTGGDDTTATVEAKDAVGAWQTLGTVAVANTLAGGGAAPRFSWRLDSSQISSPPEVRISCTAGTTLSDDLRLHGLCIVAPVQIDSEALRLRDPALGEEENIDGVPTDTATSPLDTKIIDDHALEILGGSAGDGFRARLELDERDLTAATLKFSWKLASAVSTDLTVKLFHDGTEIATIGTYSATDTALHQESTTIPLGSLPDADGIGLELEFRRSTGTTALRIAGVAVLPTFAVSAVPVDYDSGWTDVLGNTSPELVGGGAIDKLGRTTFVSLARDYRDAQAQPIQVDARTTYIDIDIANDPSDPDVPLAPGDQPAREISFRNYFEGPGLAGMQLKQGIQVEFDDTSIVQETSGGEQVAIARRVFRNLRFEIGQLPEDVGPDQVAELLLRVGNTEPFLFLVLPQNRSLSNLFSLFGKVTGKPDIAHDFARLVRAKVSMREF